MHFNNDFPSAEVFRGKMILILAWGEGEVFWKKWMDAFWIWILDVEVEKKDETWGLCLCTSFFNSRGWALPTCCLLLISGANRWSQWKADNLQATIYRTNKSHVLALRLDIGLLPFDINAFYYQNNKKVFNIFFLSCKNAKWNLFYEQHLAMPSIYKKKLGEELIWSMP